MINDIFVPYELSKELKDLGFDEPCIGLFHKDGFHSINKTKQHDEYYGQECMSPTWEQAFKFFRDKYNLHSYVDRSYGKGVYTYEYFIDINNQLFNIDTYEQAREECLKQLIKIVKDGK